ncbi:MAG: hypothetical protein ABI068_13830 [Ktedonobacterales bacterium]
MARESLQEVPFVHRISNRVSVVSPLISGAASLARRAKSAAASRKLRTALVMAGLAAATVVAGQVAQPQAAQAAPNSSWSWLHYQRGYYLDNGWLCYGWQDGAYHCTHHWHHANAGKLVSDNVAWVPNYGATTSTSKSGASHTAKAPTHTSAPAHKSTPAPVYHAPSSYPTSRQAIANEIYAVFGPYGSQAIHVAECESGLNANAWNPTPVGNSHAAGVFQILQWSTWNSTSYRGSSPYNADANIRAAHEIFVRDGYSWREWACKP